MITCSSCAKASLRRGLTSDHDIGPLFGLDRVLLDRAPALVCPNCAHVVLEGPLVEAARAHLAAELVRSRTHLSGREARFLRESIGMTQAQLADRLDIIRGTVTRWEAADDLGPVQSFALRTLAAWALEGEALAQLVSSPSSPKPSIVATSPYRIRGEALHGAA